MDENFKSPDKSATVRHILDLILNASNLRVFLVNSALTRAHLRIKHSN